MKKCLVLLSLSMFLVFPLFAADAAAPAATAAATAAVEATPAPTPVYGWKSPVMMGMLTLAQAGFDNWTAGGENNYAWTASVNSGWDYAGEKIDLVNTLKLKYGMVKGDTTGLKKSDDEIRFDSMLKYLLGIKLDPFVSFMWQTQLAPGYEYTAADDIETSRFMDPGYLKEAAGFVFNPLTGFNVMLGAAVKHTVTKRYTMKYAGKNEQFRTEPGAELAADYTLTLMENMLLTSRFESFTNFTTFDAIDMALDTSINAKVNSLISVGFNFVIKYDKDVSTKRQIKDSLTLGITYSFL